MKCPTCLGIQHGTRDTCPDCGRELAWHLVTTEEIREKCAAIRATWPACKLQQQEGYQELEIPTASRCSDGMRRREREDS